jgi:glutamate formiminotransferase
MKRRLHLISTSRAQQARQVRPPSQVSREAHEPFVEPPWGGRRPGPRATTRTVNPRAQVVAIAINADLDDEDVAVAVRKARALEAKENDQ